MYSEPEVALPGETGIAGALQTGSEARPEWWERAVAGLIDVAMFAVPGFLVQVVLIRLAYGSQLLMVAMAWLAVALTVGGFVLYKAWMESRPRQATVGKMLLGMKVVTADGRRPTFRQGALRTWPWWFAVLIGFDILISLGAAAVLLAAYVASVVGREGRGWHDRAAGCRVVVDAATA